MAFTASATVWAYRTASVPDYDAAHTTTFWFKRTGAMGEGVFVIGNTLFSEEDLIEAGGGSNLFPVAVGGGFNTGPQTFITQDVWYFVALRRVDADTMELWLGELAVAAALVSTVTYDPTSRAAASYLVLGARDTTGSQAVTNAAYDSGKQWAASLSDAEIEAERLYEAPQRTSNLWAAWPLQADGADNSGNSRALTFSASESYVTGPAITRPTAATGGTLTPMRGMVGP